MVNWSDVTEFWLMRRPGRSIRALAICAGIAAAVVAVVAAPTDAAFGQDARTQDAKPPEQKTPKQKPSEQKTPEQKMLARFPQPVLVGDLIGLPVLDGNDSTIGYVREVARTPEGKIKLIVPYGRWFGWVRNGGVLGYLIDGGRRPVAVPIEVVAILARQIAALDMERDAFDVAATWLPAETRTIASSETIRIAIQRR